MPKNNNLNLAVGDRVNHAKYGLGTVMAVEGSGVRETVTIDFGSSGTVRLMTIGGVQLIMIGIVGEYIGKILSELKARPIYFVAEHTEKHADGGAAQSATERTAAE